jgi:hypothetical protein
MNDEKEVMKVSGTTNLINRNAAGREIVGQKRNLASLQIAYKKKTGKSLSLKNCE